MDDTQALLKELRILNEHLADFKIMLAPYLGYVVKAEDKPKELSGVR